MCRPGVEGLFEVVHRDGNQSAAADRIAATFRYRLESGKHCRLKHFRDRLVARLARDLTRC